MSTFIGVIVGILGLGFLVLVHELGHYLVAKATKMRVEEFSLGFGPYLIKRRWGETVYGISAIPLGGYVRVTGMHREEFERRIADMREQEAEEAALRAEKTADGAVANARGGPAARTDRMRRRRAQDPEDRLTGKRALSAEEIASTPLRRRYYAHPLWHKLLFIVAGVAMNLIVAFVILYGLGVAQGESWMEPVVGEVVAGSGAADAGIAAGDRIVTFAGHDIETYADLQWEIPKHKGDTVTMEVERSGQLLRFADVLIQEDEDGLGRLGILASGDVGHRDIGFLRGFAYAAERTADTIVMIFQGIGMMFARDVPVTGPQGLAGVLGIVDISADFVKEGIESYLSFVVLISINLALLNMLPLLPLDGGHVVLSVVERIRRRPLSLRVFERISTVGLVLFVLLFLIAMYNDVTRIFTGW